MLYEVITLRKLGLPQETVEAIGAEMREQMSGFRARFQDPEADRDALRQQMASVRDRVLSRHLTSDQQRELAMLITAAGRRRNNFV